DLRRLVERRVRMQLDLELAACRLVDVVRELLQVLGVKVVRGIGSRQIPLRLRVGGKRERKREDEGGEETMLHFLVLRIEDSGSRIEGEPVARGSRRNPRSILQPGPAGHACRASGPDPRLL